ncbi:cup-5 [Pristionchus pacificus]|uniref:Cup-5 n=1 Tax=Pristionchus pacificus TaxID=54126 RepID=A0A8R1U4G1_PRIPA|nr:cup-5 [Pristionchus pacificus]
MYGSTSKCDDDDEGTDVNGNPMFSRFVFGKRRARYRRLHWEDEETGLLDNIEMVGRSRSSNNSRSHTPPMREPMTNFDELFEQMQDSDREVGDRLRRHLQFFFMNPMEKWSVRHQFPWKLVLQVLKIVFVTAQLVLFAELRMSHVDFMEDTTVVMRHKFLKNWDDDRDALQYPPSEGRYSVYDGKGIFEHLAFIVDAYYSLQSESFASFSYDLTRGNSKRYARDTNASLTANVAFDKIPYMEACLDRIANVSVYNNTYEFDINDVYECTSLNFTKEEVDAIRENDTNIIDILARRKITFHAEDALRISKATIKMRLRTIHFSPVTSDQRPECYLIKLSVVFDNSHHTGQVHVYINNVISYVNECNGRVIKGDSIAWDTIIMGILDICVLLLSVASFVLCLRALIKAHLLKSRAEEFFEQALKMKLSVSDKLDFLNLWYVMIVVNDTCLVIGTIAKISIEFRDFDSDLFTLTGILLGTGALLVYVGVLRYFGFFSQYNVLILTMKKAIPSILRFLGCASVLYAGFLIAGWVIIGPYSMKFRSLTSSSEALFSLLNGDDMFATFYTINDSNTVIKVFGCAYIYIFVSLFIYVVLSLFIAIIMDAYEVVKDRYSEGLTMERSLLKDFVQTCPLPEQLNSPSTRAAYSPSNLLNLAAGSDSSNSVRTLRFLDRLRDRILRATTGRGGGASRFASFTNPLDDSVPPTPASSSAPPTPPSAAASADREMTNFAFDPRQNHPV